MADVLYQLQDVLGDRYRIERELGAGAMGRVFLAEDRKLGRPVAIKVLRPEIARSLGTERFLREIRISARLTHPHILSLIDSGEADGLLYYVMFYVAGESLRDRLDRESQLGIDEAIRLTRQLAEALDHAHARGVVHRDVKPANILLEDGHALICDFGIARALGEAGREKLTQTGFAVGTPAYMSPEQGTGDTPVDHRADVYALGCVLYEMLAGSPPFSGAPPHILLARKAVQTAPGLRAVRETIPEHVERAVLKALARVPADRFESVRAFADALEDPKTATWATRRDRWARSTRQVSLAAAAALVVAATLGGAAWFLDRDGDAGPVRVRATQLTALPGLEASPSLSPDGDWVVYAGEDGSNRDIYLRTVVGERGINLTESSDADDYAPAFSPEGDRIAFRSTRDGGGLYVMGRTGEAVRRVSDRGETPAWSPDGRELVYALEDVGTMPLNMEPERSGLWVLELETGRERELLASDAVLPSWSPDGRWIAYTTRELNMRPSLWRIPAAGGDPEMLTDEQGQDWGGAWSPDGRFVYFSSDRGGSMNLWRLPMDLETGRPSGEPEPVTTPSAFAAHPSVSRAGDRIVYASVLTTQNIERARLDPATGELTEQFQLTTGSRQWSSPDPSPDGSMIAFYSRDLPEGDLYLVRRDGTDLRRLTGDSAIDRMPRWAPDARHIAYWSDRSGGIAPWLIRVDGSDNRPVAEAVTLTASADWSPDGRWLAVNVPEGTSFLMDMAGPDPSAGAGSGTPGRDGTVGPATRDPLPPPPDGIRFIINDWSPDGARLAGMLRGWTDGGVGYYDLQAREYVALTDFGQWPVWLPDSRRMLFVTGGSEYHIVDTETGETRKIHTIARDNLGPPRLTADGTEVVYSRRDTEGDLWLVTIEEP
jgi:Tol biopolymer transport system component